MRFDAARTRTDLRFANTIVLSKCFSIGRLYAWRQVERERSWQHCLREVTFISAQHALLTTSIRRANIMFSRGPEMRNAVAPCCACSAAGGLILTCVVCITMPSSLSLTPFTQICCSGWMSSGNEHCTGAFCKRALSRGSRAYTHRYAVAPHKLSRAAHYHLFAIRRRAEEYKWCATRRICAQHHAHLRISERLQRAGVDVECMKSIPSREMGRA